VRSAGALKRSPFVYPIQGVSGDHILVTRQTFIHSEQIQWAAEQSRAAVLDTLDSR
jgi:hypothetical protein